jgi:hypothetical protein
MQTTTLEHYKPAVRFGLCGVPLSNEFAVVAERGAYATLEAAWSAEVATTIPRPSMVSACASIDEGRGARFRYSGVGRRR